MVASLVLASGRVFAEDGAGALRALNVGAELAPGEVVVTGSASAAIFQVTGLGEASLGASMRWDPALGAPRGEGYRAPLEAQRLESAELAVIDHRAPAKLAGGELAGVFQGHPDAQDTSSDRAAPLGTEVVSSADLMEELVGLVRALQAISEGTASELPALRSTVSDLRDEMGALPEGQLPRQALIEQLFDALDQAGDIAYQEYARHAGDEISLLARGDGSLQVDALARVPALAEQEASADAGANALPVEILDVHSVLEGLTEQPLGDLLQVESVAGATRMTLLDTGAEEVAALWLNAPLGANASVLGLDAPEFSLPDTA